jgi:hypothetical protein
VSARRKHVYSDGGIRPSWKSSENGPGEHPKCSILGTSRSPATCGSLQPFPRHLQCSVDDVSAKTDAMSRHLVASGFQFSFAPFLTCFRPIIVAHVQLAPVK